MADFNVNPRAEAVTVTGSRGPETDVSDRLVADVQDTIFLYMPSAAPLTVFSGKVRQARTVHQFEYKFLEQDEYPRSVTLAADSNAADTTLDLSAGQGVRIPKYAALVNLRTRETVYVTSISTDELTVTRGIGGAAIDMVTGDTLVLTRTVHEDGSKKGDFKTVQTDSEFNYTEIIKTGFGFTGRQQNTDQYGGNDVNVTRKWAGIEHLKSIEHMMFFGTRHKLTGSGGHLTTFSGGADFFVKSNVWNLGGTVPTERAFIEFLEEGMRWGKGGNHAQGSGVKYLFLSARWATEINAWAHDRIRLIPKDKTLGIQLGELLTPHGTVMLVRAPILDYNHQDRAYLFDLNHVRNVRHQGRGTKLLKNINDPDLDGMEEQYQSDVGAQFELEASHAVLKGLSV